MRRARPGLVLVLALAAAACGTTATAAPRHSGTVTARHGAAPDPSVPVSSATSASTTLPTIPAAGTPRATTATTTTRARGATATTTTVAPSTLLVQFGSGNADSAQFTVSAASWQLNWSYNCAAFGPVGNFITTINGYGDAIDTPDIGTDQLGGHGTGDNVYDDQGTFNISIDSECSWSIAVVQP